VSNEHEPACQWLETNWQWLESTRELQEKVYGFDFTALRDNREALADYLVHNHTAAVLELSEALSEVGWKTWATPRGWVNRTAFIKELVDVAHFIGNMLVAVGCDDEEWENYYREKQDVNRKRQADGYDGVSTKCPDCKRALDDVGVDHQCSGR
jgi:hypothetical protein